MLLEVFTMKYQNLRFLSSNVFFNEGVFPEKLRTTKITPIFKNGEPVDLTNYKPISVLPFFSKVLEKLIYNKVYDFIT